MGKKLSKEFAGKSKSITLQRSQQAKQKRTNLLKKSLHRHLEERNACFSSRPVILMSTIRLINFIELQLLI